MEENTEKKEFSYDELKGICTQLSEQNRILVSQMQKINQEEFHKYVNYLFRVLENSDKFNSEFVQKCVNDIITSLTPVEENPTEKK